MKKISLKKKNTIIITLILILIIMAIVIFTSRDNSKYKDTIKFKGEIYYLLEYNKDIFNYNFYSNEYYEEDEIHPIKHEKWEIVYFSGDLFLPKEEVKKADKYYSDDENYDWFITTEENDVEKMIPVNLTEDELKFIYDLENKEKKETFKFEDIEKFAEITKISKDRTVYAMVSLARHNNTWYWKTEIMSDYESDREYIVKLPDSLNKKINNLISK